MNTRVFGGYPDAVIGISARGVVEYWSKGAERTFGYTGMESLGRNLTELIVPEEHFEEVRRTLLEAVAAGTCAYESMFQHKDGSLVYVGLVVKARNNSSEAVLLVSTKKDETHQRMVREARILEMRFHDVVESMPNAIVVVNRLGHIILANTKAEQLFDYHRGAMLGKTMEDLLPACQRVAQVERHTKFFNQPSAYALGMDLDLFGLRADGMEFPIEINFGPLHVDDDIVMMSEIRDVTAHKRFEWLLRQRNVELLAANQAKDRLMTSMSQELCVPLGTLINAAGNLKLSGVSGMEQAAELDTVQASARRLSMVLGNLLGQPEAEIGERDHEAEFVECRRLIAEVVEALRLKASQVTGPETFAARIEPYLRPELRAPRPAQHL